MIKNQDGIGGFQYRPMANYFLIMQCKLAAKNRLFTEITFISKLLISYIALFKRNSNYLEKRNVRKIS